jgi:hypothetical protein
VDLQFCDPQLILFELLKSAPGFWLMNLDVVKALGFSLHVNVINACLDRAQQCHLLKLSYWCQRQQTLKRYYGKSNEISIEDLYFTFDLLHICSHFAGSSRYMQIGWGCKTADLQNMVDKSKTKLPRANPFATKS